MTVYDKVIIITNIGCMIFHNVTIAAAYEAVRTIRAYTAYGRAIVKVDEVPITFGYEAVPE